MIKSSARVAVAGAIGGAALAIAVIFGAAALGVFPPGGDQRIHDYLITHPQVLVEAGNRLQQVQDATDDAKRSEAVQKLGTGAFFNPRLAFIIGPAKVHSTFVEFFDYNCPYCRASLPAVKRFMTNHRQDVRFAFIEFPIKGPQSITASRAAIAARKQPDKYLAFHFLLMAEKELVTPEVIYADAERAGLDVNKLKADMQEPSVDAAIAGAHSLAAAANVDGTPAFVVNGHIREGAVDDSDLQRMLKF
jgi:protein-disulfide isomerase